MTTRTWLTDVLWLDADVCDWRPVGGRGTERFVATPDVAGAKQLLRWHPSSALASARRTMSRQCSYELASAGSGTPRYS